MARAEPALGVEHSGRETGYPSVREVLAVALIGLVVAGCAGARWGTLPPPRSGVLAYYDSGDPGARRATLIARRLTRARPLPVEKVYVFSSSILDRVLAGGTPRFPADNAGAFRCGKGAPPPHGCIYVGDRLLAGLSGDALAGVLAHELGHLEKGHRPTGALRTALGIGRAGFDLCGAGGGSAAGLLVSLIGCGVGLAATAGAAGAAGASREVEHEADEAGALRLAAAGYCAGPVMQATFAEIEKLAPGGGGGGLFASHPGYRERAERAGADCGPPAPSAP